MEVMKRQEMLIQNKQMLAPTDPGRNLLKTIKQVIGDKQKSEDTSSKGGQSIFNIQRFNNE